MAFSCKLARNVLELSGSGAILYRSTEVSKRSWLEGSLMSYVLDMFLTLQSTLIPKPWSYIVSISWVSLIVRGAVAPWQLLYMFLHTPCDSEPCSSVRYSYLWSYWMQVSALQSHALMLGNQQKFLYIHLEVATQFAAPAFLACHNEHCDRRTMPFGLTGLVTEKEPQVCRLPWYQWF